MQPASITAVFIIPPKVHLLDITGPAHIFYEATCYGAPVQSVYSSLFPGQTIETSSCALSFQQLIPYDQLQLKAGDIIFIPGLEAGLLLGNGFYTETRDFQYWLKKQYEQGVWICSVCTGAFLLAASGLLDGKSCTTHWKYTQQFTARFPDIRLLDNRLFVQEDDLHTSAGVSSGIDLALHITERLWGAAFAAKIAKEVVVYFRRGADDPQLSVFTQYRNHLEQRIHIIQDLLSQKLDRKYSIEELAEKVRMSPRNLTRAFKKAADISIGEYLRKLRVERALELLKEGHTYQSVALQCGLASVSQLKQLLANAKADRK